MRKLQAITPVQSIRDAVYDQLKDAILSGSFDKGERLVEQDLASRLQVSRTPVREALRRLETEGILEALPRQGLIVKEYTDDEIREIYLIREALESLAADYAARNADKRDIAFLEQTVREMIAFGEDPNADLQDAMDVHRRFSEAYNRASHMPTLVNMIESIKEQVARFRRVSLSGSKRRHQAQEEHKQLLEALKAKDPELAVTLTRKHLRGALEAYFESKKGVPETGKNLASSNG